MRRRIGGLVAALLVALVLVVGGVSSPASACRPTLRHPHACGWIESQRHHRGHHWQPYELDFIPARSTR